MDSQKHTTDIMLKWLKLSDRERLNVLTQISRRTKMSPQAIEKDWWVTIILKALFSMPFANHLLFKGGTSLSKCWDLIERLSEDVDVSIDREYLGFSGELSKTQISDKLRRASCSFIRNILTHELKSQLTALGVPENIISVRVNITSVTTTDPEIIEVHYPSVIQHNDYILNRVLVEVSGRSMSEPHETISINSLISQSYPDAIFAERSFPVRVVSPKRTFIEKACLLHEEFSKEIQNIRIERMSRHLYDLEKLMDTSIAQAALQHKELYEAIIEHRQKFIGLKGFDYSTLVPQRIIFVPHPDIMPFWKNDYERMRTTMIYGSSLPFEHLIERITLLNRRFSEVQW